MGATAQQLGWMLTAARGQQAVSESINWSSITGDELHTKCSTLDPKEGDIYDDCVDSYLACEDSRSCQRKYNNYLTARKEGYQGTFNQWKQEKGAGFADTVGSIFGGVSSFFSTSPTNQVSPLDIPSPTDYTKLDRDRKKRNTTIAVVSVAAVGLAIGAYFLLRKK